MNPAGPVAIVVRLGGAAMAKGNPKPRRITLTRKWLRKHTPEMLLAVCVKAFGDSLQSSSRGFKLGTGAGLVGDLSVICDGDELVLVPCGGSEPEPLKNGPPPLELAVVVRTHVLDAAVARNIARISASVSAGFGDAAAAVLVVYDDERRTLDEALEAHGAPLAGFTVLGPGDDDGGADAVPRRAILWHRDAHMARANALHRHNWLTFETQLVWLHRRLRQGGGASQSPRTVWMFDYDARFSGDVCDLVRALADDPADLVSDKVWRHQRMPHWYHWDKLTWPPGALGLAAAPPVAGQLRHFAAVVRVSRRLLDALEEHLGVVSGHAELYPSTLCAVLGWPTASLEAAGVKGSHFCFEPPISEGAYEKLASAEPGRLFHPVKTDRQARAREALAARADSRGRR